MEEKGLRTKENQDILLEAGKRIHSSARQNYNKKHEWHVLLFEESPASDRATIWITPTHIRIYAGKNTPLFKKLPDEPTYRDRDKERRKTLYNMAEALDFIDNTLCNRSAPLVDSINTPMKPKACLQMDLS